MKNMLNKETLLTGDRENPYHLSIGQVVFDKNNRIALIEKKDGTITLPRETTYLNENYSEALVRGALEELGVTVIPIRFIGSLITTFNRDPQTIIEKSTLYFLSRVEEVKTKHLEDDELDDTVLWTKPSEAIEKLKEQNNPEFGIILRAFEGES